MRDKNVKEGLQNKVKDYLEFMLKEMKERDMETENNLIDILPANIKAELYYEMNTFFFKDFAWTKRFSDQFISALSLQIEESVYMDGFSFYEVGGGGGRR